MYPQQVIDALRTVRYPGTGQNIVEMGILQDNIRCEGQHGVTVTLAFERPTDPFIRSLVRNVETTIKTQVDPEADVKVVVEKEAKKAPKPTDKPILPGVKNIIGIASGKGGVGKSTVSANLAVALSAEGYRVGLLDADIFGPSIPKMFGIEDEQLYVEQRDGRQLIVPAERYGVKVLSIGFLIDKNSAAVWRGSMASNALKQLITDALWGDLDYLLIDMPPGTSDIHLTLVQTLAITGVIIVSTPQEVALADVRKGVSMFTGPKVGVPVLGIVENMAWFTPAQHPDERYYIFGDGGAARLAEELHVPLLAQIPIVADICCQADKGAPIALEDNAAGEAFRHLAREVVDAVDRRNDMLPPTVRVQVK